MSVLTKARTPWWHGTLLLVVLFGVACAQGPGAEVEAPAASPYVLVLGTAQDAGLPQIGCQRNCCASARQDPSRQRRVTSLLLADPASGQRWLFDASPDLPEQVERCAGHPKSRAVEGPRPPLFEGIFLTHAHMGHYSGLLHLGPEAYGARRVPTFATARMGEFLRSNGPWSLLVENGGLELHTLEPGQQVVLTDHLRVTAVAVPHRDEFSDTVAFHIEGPERSLLYLPDIDKWERWDTSIESWITAVDYALLDGTFFAAGEVPGRSMAEIPHPFIEESLQRFAPLTATQRHKILFTHLNHTNPSANPASSAAATIRAAGMAVAFDGQILRL